jgi:hypothetical protein
VWDASGGRRVERVGVGAGELALELGEGVDEFGGFEGAVSAARSGLLEHGGVLEAADGFVDGSVASADEGGGALCTVMIGAPGRASISRSTAEPDPTRPRRWRQAACTSVTRSS